MIYVAFLRGINVGGNNKVSMAELKAVFERAGMRHVSSYINSGNVIFESNETSEIKLARLLEKVIEEKFGFFVKVLVWNKGSLLALADRLPDMWVNDTTMKCDVMFLWKDIDNSEIINQLTIKPGIDDVEYYPGALLWRVDRDKVTRSGIMKLVGTSTYKHMTIRNCNTLRKLAFLVKS